MREKPATPSTECLNAHVRLVLNEAKGFSHPLQLHQTVCYDSVIRISIYWEIRQDHHQTGPSKQAELHYTTVWKDMAVMKVPALVRRLFLLFLLQRSLSHEPHELLIVSWTTHGARGPQLWHAWWSAVSPTRAQTQTDTPGGFWTAASPHTERSNQGNFSCLGTFYSSGAQPQVSMGKTCLKNSIQTHLLTRQHGECTDLSLCEKEEQ